MLIVFAVLLFVTFALVRALLVRETGKPLLAASIGAVVALALVVGAVLEPIMFGSVASAGSSPTSKASDASGSAAANGGSASRGAAVKPSVLHLTAAQIAALREGASDGLGSIDALDASGAAQGATLPYGKPLVVRGWAADPATHAPAAAVLLIVDGHERVDASSGYGFDRPDVAKFYHMNAMENTGFQNVAVPTAALGRGLHSLQLAVVPAGGTSFVRIRGAWTFRLQ